MDSWVNLYSMWKQVPREAREGIGSPVAGVIGGYELLCGCWEQNPDHLQVQYMLLTTEHLSSPWK